jgi:hypothetical protein
MTDPYFVITSEGGQVYSNEIQSEGIGVELQSRLTGLGLPPVAAQFDEGLGDGSTYRGARVLSRNIDFVAHLYAPSREQLRSILDRFSMVLAYPCTVTFIDFHAQEAWSVAAARTGGGDYNYGDDSDSGKSYVNLEWTMQTDNPYWQAETVQAVANDATWEVEVDNHGTVPARPIWRVTGPTKGFHIQDEDDEDVLVYSDFIPEGQTIIVDTETGTVKDQDGTNRYSGVGSLDLDVVAIPPGPSKYTFVWDQSSDVFEESLVRTNHVPNPAFRIDPFTSGGFTISGSFSYDSANDWVEYRTYAARSTNNPAINTSITGLEVGKTYQVVINNLQRWSLIGGHTPQSGYLRVKNPDGSYALNKTIAWKPSSLGRGALECLTQTVTFVATSTSVVVAWKPPYITYSGKTYEGTTSAVGHCAGIYVGDPGSVFDGSTADHDNVDYAWTGTANNSKSTETTTWDVEVPVEGTGLACEVEFRPLRWLVI